MMLPLKQLRESKGITQAELSSMLRISPSTVGMWEQGRREPDYETLKRIAVIFNVSTDYLLGNNYEKSERLSNKQTALLRGFNELSDDGQRTLLNVLDGLRAAFPARVAV